MSGQLTNLIINLDEENKSSIASGFGIEKAVVRAHTRKSKSGKLSQVKQYMDKRRKKEMDKEDVRERREGWKELEEHGKKQKKMVDDAYAKQGLQMTRRQKKHARAKSKREQMKRSHEYDKGNIISHISSGHEFVVNRTLSDGRHEIEKLRYNKNKEWNERTGKKRIINAHKARHEYGMISEKDSGLDKKTAPKAVKELKKRNKDYKNEVSKKRGKVPNVFGLTVEEIKRENLKANSELQNFLVDKKITHLDPDEVVKGYKKYHKNLFSMKYSNLYDSKLHRAIAENFNVASHDYPSQNDALKLAQHLSETKNHVAFHNMVLDYMKLNKKSKSSGNDVNAVNKFNSVRKPLREKQTRYAKKRWSQLSSVDKGGFLGRVMKIKDKQKKEKIMSSKFDKLSPKIRANFKRWINSEPKFPK